MDKIYLASLDALTEKMDAVANTRFTAAAKVITLATMNMRYEQVAFTTELPEHPFVMTKAIIDDAITMFDALTGAAFIEAEDRTIGDGKPAAMEDKHQDLFNEIWNRYEDDVFRTYVDRYVRRVDVNNLVPLIEGKRCVDMGAGNGVFAFALLERGAGSVVGVDYGEKSIAYANDYAAHHGLSDRAEFKVATVYETGCQDAEFDFAIQNGVFHHLDNEDRAYRETYRILKPGGYFWVYTDGEGGISYDLFDRSVHLLKDVPILYVESVLESLNISRDKVAHLSDGMGATYRHTSWDEITGRLASMGFGEFKRLVGGYPTDFDHDRIAADPYGAEKFGEGDLRILCRKMEG